MSTLEEFSRLSLHELARLLTEAAGQRVTVATLKKLPWPLVYQRTRTGR